MREPIDLRAFKDSNELKIGEIIEILDKLIPEVQSIDPLSGNLLLTTKTLLWSKLQAQGHPCNGCSLQKEIARLATS
jgi:hypothetical protein